jgi:hypothetical protein
MSYTENIESLIAERDALRRALEIIAVGDAQNPQLQAAEELIALGYWRDIPEARIPVTAPAVGAPNGMCKTVTSADM